MDKLNVLYEDNHIIVVVKPRGILSQADDTNDIDMLTIIKEYIKNKYHKPGNVYIGLVHRLDRPTSGVMVFARTSKAAGRLSDQIRKGVIIKKYLAIVHGYLKNKNGKLEDYLIKDNDTNISKVTDNKHGKYASLSYNVLEEKNNKSLVDILLETGRSHQIRVQFSNIGNPLLGDQKYGKDNYKDLMLCAYHLEFDHPVTKEHLVFEYKNEEFKL